MKHLIKIAGLCLVAMFAVSMVAAATASAAEARWEQCSEGPAEKTPTKYTEHQCTVSRTNSEGKWQWNEIKNTEEVRIRGSLNLKDTKTLAGESAVECYGEAVGDVGPGQYGRIQSVPVEAKNCHAVKVCENVEEVKARNLPWQIEIYETENTVLGRLENAGNGEPGWEVKCKAPILGSTTDECLAEAGNPETLLFENKNTGGETPLLVLATFEHARKAKCSLGGAKSGEVTGSLAILKANKWGLRVR
jgi:hypothetical protein